MENITCNIFYLHRLIIIMELMQGIRTAVTSDSRDLTLTDASRRGRQHPGFSPDVSRGGGEEDRREGGGGSRSRFSFPHAFPAPLLSLLPCLASRWVRWRASVSALYAWVDPDPVSGTAPDLLILWRIGARSGVTEAFGYDLKIQKVFFFPSGEHARCAESMSFLILFWHKFLESAIENLIIMIDAAAFLRLGPYR